MEDIACLLTSCDIPNLLDETQLDIVMEHFNSVCLSEQLPLTKLAIYNRFIKEVKQNLHIVLAFSPIGELFKSRIRMFPALVNNCTICWFSVWPYEALVSIGKAELSKAQLLDQLHGVLADIFAEIHSTTRDVIAEYSSISKRQVYVTSAFFLTLISSFISIFTEQQRDITTKQMGVDSSLVKLRETELSIAELKEVLKRKQPQLEEMKVKIQALMDKLSVDQSVANAKQEEARCEEAKVSEKAETCRQIQKQCAEQVAEAEPALNEAVKVLKLIKSKDLGELGNYPNPPLGVKYVCEAVCIMLEFGECPKDCIVGPVHKKEANWWLVAKQKLKDPKSLVEVLVDGYNKQKITETLIGKIQVYMDNPDFTPQKAREQSLACMALCAWVHAMYKWYFINKEVMPLRAQLSKAESDLEAITTTLNITRSNLKKVEEDVMNCEYEFSKAVQSQQELENELNNTEVKIDRAGRLIDGLMSEKGRWENLSKQYADNLVNIVGDSILASACITYFGPLTSTYRNKLLETWYTILSHKDFKYSPSANLVSLLSTPLEIQQWQMNALPNDSLSTENAIISFNSSKWPYIIDPQFQANNWLKTMYGESLVVIQPLQPDFIKRVENALVNGSVCLIENVTETLDSSLDYIISKAVFHIGNMPHIKLGNNTVSYNGNFRLFVTTGKSLPALTPEEYSKFVVLNFFVTKEGLAEQLLGRAVQLERLDLEQEKNALLKLSTDKKLELNGLQAEILALIQGNDGDLLGEETLVATLELSKAKSIEVADDLEKIRVNGGIIDRTRNKYLPYALSAAQLFFVVASLSEVDSMYQFSLRWFERLFVGSIEGAPRCGDVEVRVGELRGGFSTACTRT